MAVRKMVKIDEELCDGCGMCVPSCAEGALQVVDGKARLLRDDFCDGLGACLGDCPQGAITIEEREAADFDEEAVTEHLARTRGVEAPAAAQPGGPSASALEHWPVKLKLIPPGAPFLAGKDLLLVADCVPIAYPDLHRELLPGRAVAIGCPKFDDFAAELDKLTAVLRESDVRSLTIVHMEVPCCFGYRQMAKQAMERSGKDLPIEQVVISARGTINREARPVGACPV